MFDTPQATPRPRLDNNIVLIKYVSRADIESARTSTGSSGAAPDLSYSYAVGIIIGQVEDKAPGVRHTAPGDRKETRPLILTSSKVDITTDHESPYFYARVIDPCSPYEWSTISQRTGKETWHEAEVSGEAYSMKKLGPNNCLQLPRKTLRQR